MRNIKFRKWKYKREREKKMSKVYRFPEKTSKREMTKKIKCLEQSFHKDTSLSKPRVFFFNEVIYF